MRTRKLLTAPHGLILFQRLPISFRRTILRSQLLRQEPYPSIYNARNATTTSLRFSSTSTQTDPSPSPSRIVRPLVPPPRAGSGPLLTRLPNRALPSIPRLSIWVKTLPIFALLITLSSLAIFNYEKSSSSTVNSILFALRTNEHTRELLGDEIYFASSVPLIRGELNTLHGHIDIKFWVKGTRGKGEVEFVARRMKSGYFETLQWNLRMEDGRTVQLLELEGSRDPLEGQQ